MATVRDPEAGTIGARRRNGRPTSRAAQLLLDVPAAYGGRGAWMDGRSSPQLRRLLERCREDLALFHGTTPRKCIDQVLEGVRLPAARRRRCFMAGLFDSAGELCAVVDVARSEPGGEWWLGVILVRPDLRGRGIGAGVLEALEHWVRAEGGRAIHVALQRRNRPALHFARRSGFVVNGEAAGAAGEVYLLVKKVA
jgi:GNAT superfamily N-acetyltransferase